MSEGRKIRVITPLGEDQLLLARMTAREELGRPFEVRLELLSKDHEIGIPEILGQSVTLHLPLPEEETRYFNGLVSEFSYAGTRGNHALYRAVVRPWLWFLTRTGDCRIFQELTVPEIVKEVFREHGFSDFDESLSESYRTRGYCTQYDETDFDFVSRLLEEEGIYYYFRHEDGKHTLVLADAYGAHEAIAVSAQLPFFSPSKEEKED